MGWKEPNYHFAIPRTKTVTKNNTKYCIVLFLPFTLEKEPADDILSQSYTQNQEISIIRFIGGNLADMQ
jgi:hypothetical protein